MRKHRKTAILGRIARDSIEEVRQANDIVDVIQAYVPLKKRGANFWACCPFHDEQTPSFAVSAPRQTFKCFGCGEFGNAIDFIMKYERLTFVEAVEKLADRGSVTLRFDGKGPSKQERSTRASALEVLEWAQRGFKANLERNDAAMKYLSGRNLDGSIAMKWGIGYAPDEWERQYNAARKVFSNDAILASGLCRQGDTGKWYDFFRGRITFPIRDAQARIVGFGARTLDPDAKSQKYLNSAEGMLFSKSKVLYAMDKLHQSEFLKKTGRALIMEGYTDVIAAHEAGFDSAVAPLGTSITTEQLALLRRYSKGVTLVLDGDSAGIKAAERGVDLVLAAGVDAMVVSLPAGKDPFDLIRNDSAEAFQRLLDDAQDAFDFKLSLLRKRHDVNRPVEAEKALGELADTISQAESDSLRSLYARKAAVALQVPEKAVIAAIARVRGKQRGHHGGSHNVAPAVSNSAQMVDTPALSYQRMLLRRLIEMPSVLGSAADQLLPTDFDSPALAEVYREVQNCWDEYGEVSPGALVTLLSPAAKAEFQRVADLLQQGAEQDPAEREQEEIELLKEIERFASSQQSKRNNSEREFPGEPSWENGAI
ncbi:DNA primase [Planctomycetota bacterium]|nr:DNA primase [Planctomycetota bacterium]